MGTQFGTTYANIIEISPITIIKRMLCLIVKRNKRLSSLEVIPVAATATAPTCRIGAQWTAARNFSIVTGSGQRAVRQRGGSWPGSRARQFPTRSTAACQGTRRNSLPPWGTPANAILSAHGSKEGTSLVQVV